MGVAENCDLTRARRAVVYTSTVLQSAEMVLSFAVILLSVLLSGRPALAAISLVCESVQNLCPDDNVRRCTCISTESSLKWRTSGDKFFGGNGIAFDSSHALGTNATNNGFTVILTNNTVGHLTSVMVFAPTSVRTTGLTVICEVSGNPSSATMTNLNVTYAGLPGQPEFVTPVSRTCGSSHGKYQATIQWNIADTGGVSLLNYTGSVSSSGFNSSTKINSMSNAYSTTEELSCSTEYLITVRANNCAGSGNSSTLSLTTVLNTPTITKVCTNSGSLVVNWMAPVIPANSCYSVTSYTVTLINDMGETIAMNASGTVSSAAVGVPSGIISQRITVTANTECGSSTSSPLEVQSSDLDRCVSLTVSPSTTSVMSTTTLDASSVPVLSATCQVALGVGIPLTFLLTAAITALLASFITYLCLNRMRTHTYITRPPAQEPSYDYVHHKPGSLGTEGTVKMERNVSYGEIKPAARESNYY